MSHYPLYLPFLIISSFVLSIAPPPLFQHIIFFMNYNNWRHDFRDCGNLHRFTDFINNRCYDLFIFAFKKIRDFYIKSLCDTF